MKWLLISCILIIFTIGLMHADSEGSDENNCIEQLTNQSRLEQSCMDQSQYNEAEYVDELQKTLLQYSGDNDSVYAFADKYCPRFSQLLNCSLIGHDVPVECLYPFAKAIDQQRYDVTRALLNYVCANRVTIFLRVLEGNGLDTIYLNKKFDKCVKLVGDVRKKIDEETLGPSNEICDGLDRFFECYANMVLDHPNQNLIEIASELHVIFRQAIKC